MIKNNNMIEMLSQGWDGFNWMDTWIYTYNYDTNNNMIEEIWQSWGGSNWVNYKNIFYSYSPTDVEELPGEIKTYSLSNNYPNPFNPSTTINFDVPADASVLLSLYDMQGKFMSPCIKLFV